tara:strand:+ start:438 stop:1076 length:639 start_codon:yes stop_codon:yes gene_type:complete
MNYVIDYDSTFIQVESLDELSKTSKSYNLKNQKEIEKITNMGMDGKISFSESLERRIKLINSSIEDIRSTLEVLENRITISFLKNKNFFKTNSDKIFIVSSGFHELIDPIVLKFGIKKEHIFANNFLFKDKNIVGFDRNNPLSRSKGKVEIIKRLNLKGKVLVIGDGYTDYEIKKDGYADSFFLFTENIKRDSIVKSADYLLKSLDELFKII